MIFFEHQFIDFFGVLFYDLVFFTSFGSET